MEACTRSSLGCESESVGLTTNFCSYFLQMVMMNATQCVFSPASMWPADYGPTAVENGLGEYDYIIVGGGSAGSMVADRLTENANCNVLLLEAGDNPPDEEEIPYFRFALLGTKYDYKYFARSKHACQGFDRGCYCPLGKMLGGSGAHNSLLYLRGNDRDYNTWETSGNPTWGWTNVLRYFKKSEKNLNPVFLRNQLYHSGRGKLLISEYYRSGPLGDVLTAALNETGHHYLADFNGGMGWLGYGWAQGTLAYGRRQSTAKTFLTPASRRPNLHVIKNAIVSKVVIKKKKAIGVKFTINGTENLFAGNRKDVILSAGTISSPHILLLSGVGPKEHLRKFGIAVQKHLPGVGGNLHDHATVPIFYSFKTSIPGINPQEVLLQSFAQFAINNTGPLTGIGMANLNTFIKTKGGGPYPDAQVSYQPFNANTTEFDSFVSIFGLSDPAKSALVAESMKNDMLIIGCSLLKPKSRGTVRLNTNSIDDQPDIDLNWLDHNDDVETLVSCVKQQVELQNTRVFRANGGKHLRPILPACDSFYDTNLDDYYRCYASQLTVTSYHPVGTCKMGPHYDKEAVVDHRLRVRGVKNLRVIDASIMPVIPSASTNAATIMIAEKGSDFAKFDWSRFNSDYSTHYY